MTSPIPFILKDSFVAVMIAGKMSNIDSTHPNFSKIVNALRDKDWDAVPALIDLPAAVSKFGAGKVVVVGDSVLYDGFELHGTLVNRILKMIEQKFDVAPLIKFLENVQKNPVESARKELYDFLEASNMPITEDGHFLAYKRVGMDFKDLHSRTFDNSPGKIVKEDRKLLDTNRNNVCSKGLHFAAFSYLDQYAPAATTRTIIVKINPADIVAIPIDYGNAKGRCCQYEVVGIYGDAVSKKDVLKESPAVVNKTSVINGINIDAWADVDLRKKLENLSMNDLVYLHKSSGKPTPSKFKNKEVGISRIINVYNEFRAAKKAWVLHDAQSPVVKMLGKFFISPVHKEHLTPSCQKPTSIIKNLPGVAGIVTTKAPMQQSVTAAKFDVKTANLEVLTKNELICLHNELVLPDYRRKSFDNKEDAIKKIRALTLKELNTIVS